MTGRIRKAVDKFEPDVHEPKKRVKKEKADNDKPAAKKGSKKVKTKKDGTAKAARGKSSFMFYSIEVRPSVVKANPDLKFGEVGKKIGEQWRALPEKDKVCVLFISVMNCRYSPLKFECSCSRTTSQVKYEKLAAKDKEAAAKKNAANKA